jgi:hypothetical protein
MKKVIVIIVLLVALAAFAQHTFSPSLVSFTAGQVSPRMEMRSQFPKYKTACRTLENMFVRPQGPVSRRPGTEYIADVNDSNFPARLIPFEYSTDDSYVLAFDNGYLGFYRTTE